MEEYSLEERYLFNDYVEGKEDKFGRKISKIVFRDENRYIVYLVEGDYLNAYYSMAEDVMHSIGSDFQEWCVKLDGLNVPNKEEYEFIGRRTASAYEKELRGNNEEACKEIKDIFKTIKGKYYIKRTAISLIFLGILVFTTIILNGFEVDSDAVLILSSFIASYMGTIYVYIKEKHKKSLMRFSPYVDSIFALLQSVLSAAIIICTIKSGIFLSTFKENIYAITLFCFIGGFFDDIPIKMINKIKGMLVNEVEDVKEVD